MFKAKVRQSFNYMTVIKKFMSTLAKVQKWTKTMNTEGSRQKLRTQEIPFYFILITI